MSLKTYLSIVKQVGKIVRVLPRNATICCILYIIPNNRIIIDERIRVFHTLSIVFKTSKQIRVYRIPRLNDVFDHREKKQATHLKRHHLPGISNSPNDIKCLANDKKEKKSLSNYHRNYLEIRIYKYIESSRRAIILHR